MTAKERRDRWKAANPEKHRESMRKGGRKYREANREARLEATRQWKIPRKAELSEKQKAKYDANPQEFIAKTKRYYEANKDRINERQRLYSATAEARAIKAAYHAKHGDEIKRKAREYARKHRDHQRDQRMMREYGITQAQFDCILALQNSVCASCLRSSSKGPLHVDHDHDTGRVRGLLCNPCNRSLAAHHSPATLRRMADYLESKFDGRLPI